MAIEKFERLVRDFCQSVNLDQPEKVMAGEAVIIDQVNISFLYAATTIPDKVFLYFDYGVVPDDRALQVSQALLKQNHATYAGAGRSFGLTKDAKRVILSDHLDLQSANSELLLNKLRLEIELVKRWRENYFLEDLVVDEKISIPLASQENRFAQALANQLRKQH